MFMMAVGKQTGCKMNINIELTPEQIDMIGWSLLHFVAYALPENFQKDEKQAIDIMKKIKPNTVYEFRSIDV